MSTDQVKSGCPHESITQEIINEFRRFEVSEIGHKMDAVIAYSCSKTRLYTIFKIPLQLFVYVFPESIKHFKQ